MISFCVTAACFCYLQITDLSLHRCDVGDDGATHLLDCIHNLENLKISRCGVSPELTTKLREDGRKVGCRVFS